VPYLIGSTLKAGWLAALSNGLSVDMGTIGKRSLIVR